MPDPLLSKLGLSKEIEKAKQIAERYGAVISSQDQYVFLETKNSASCMMLARIDCKNYPDELDVDFLDPKSANRVSAKVSNNPEHWPKSPNPIKKGDRFHLCLVGIKSYLLFHHDPGFVLPLHDLIRTLILWCRGKSQLLRLTPPARTPMRRVKER